MKTILIVLIVLVFPIRFSIKRSDIKAKNNYYNSFLLPTTPSSIEEKWESFMLYRMKQIEKKSGIYFTYGWVPRVKFDIPSSIQYPDQFPGCYDQETRSFFINPALLSRDIETMQEFIDHELGHALADQVSYKFRNYPWPEELDMKSLDDDIRISTKILSEGVAEYFANLFYENVKTSPDWLPSGYEMRYLMTRYSKDNTWPYDGGHFIVEPIIEQYGESGLMYIIAHKFSFENGDIRNAGILYQQTALRKLGEK